MTDPTRRFSSRVENYSGYRPGYPAEMIAALRAEGCLNHTDVIADIGAGTGLLTELFLRHGHQVFAVEPNLEMRTAGEQRLRPYPGFHSVAGRAEATTLASQSVDLVAAGQAFHWFDRQPTRQEFSRILKPGGWILLVWNERATQATPFLQAYEQLLQRYATDYAQVHHKRIDETVLSDFYGPDGFNTQTFRQQQTFDYAGVQGRLLSSSYAPEADHPSYAAMLDELKQLFQTYAVGGRIVFEYVTRMYTGQLSQGAAQQGDQPVGMNQLHGRLRS